MAMVLAALHSDCKLASHLATLLTGQRKVIVSAMIESLLMVGTAWFIHAVAAGLPAIVAFFGKVPIRWFFVLALLAAPFWALLPAQTIWPVGGASSYFTRLIVLTFVVFVAEIVEVSPVMRKAPAWCHLLVLAIAVLAVIPLQLSVPALPD
jgi:hypothetical protein